MTLSVYVVIACWAAFLVYWLAASLFVKHEASPGRFVRGWILRTLLIVVVVAVLDGLAPKGLGLHLNSTYTASGPWQPLGAALAVFGIAIAFYARYYLGREWSPIPSVKEGHQLVTNGPYKIIRHPIYTGVLLAMAGTAIVSPVWVIVLILFVGIFLNRVRVEEGLMTTQFPNEYPAYKARTWRLIPYVF